VKSKYLVFDELTEFHYVNSNASLEKNSGDAGVWRVSSGHFVPEKDWNRGSASDSSSLPSQQRQSSFSMGIFAVSFPLSLYFFLNLLLCMLKAIL
jgi:hypothetical protein